MADNAFSPSFGPGVLLFDEDFDQPSPRSEPEIIEPVYSAAELAEAREAAARESRDRALAEADASARTIAGQALQSIATQLAAARDEAGSIAEQAAEALARLLLGCFATAFPALSARHGQTEVAVLLREILPALRREPKIAVRANPRVIDALTGEMHGMDADLASRVRLVATDAMPPGDARISWEHGTACRDTSSLWHQIEDILAPAGLLNPAHLPAETQPVKEHALVE